MGEAVLTFAAEELVKKLTSLAAQEISLAWGFKAELKRLRKTLFTIQDYLAGVHDNPQEKLGFVQSWVKKLKGVAQDADDVLDEFDYELLRRKVELQNRIKKKVLNFFSLSNPVVFRFKMAHKIQKINASLADLKSEASIVGLVSKKIDAAPEGGTRRRLQTDSLPEKDGVIVGREKDVADIVTTLTSSNFNQEDLSVMAIVGMGGLGKTTLAREIYNHASINKYFEKKIWVCVSDTFDIEAILRFMLESLDSKANVRENQDAILKCLREELKEKKVLLVLDDVWNEERAKWNDLIDRLFKLNVAPGSKIIVTTRNARVASISEKLLPRPNLGLLSPDECWRIMKNRAFPKSTSDIAPVLEEVGREIAKKCAGVPLAAKVLGGILLSKHSISEWLSIKENRLWELPEGDERIMSILRLSFDNLTSPSLKQCFAYCSMFLKDVVIERDNLVQLWMAQGLLHPSPENSNLEMEDLGNEYFDILFESSLFQDAELDDDGVVTKCKMHDLVHDLAERVSETESMMQDFHKTGDRVEIQDVVHASTSIIERIPEGSFGKLRSLFTHTKVLASHILPRFKALRVLNLYEAEIRELPISIGKLKHLRYLDISKTKIKELPRLIGQLYNLQTLRATNCPLEEFPKEVKNLINLRHVYFDEKAKFSLGVLGRLTSLRTLPPFHVDKDMGREIEELASLNQLNGKLIIGNLEHVKDEDEARKAKLEEKKKLDHLELIWTKDRPTINNNNEEDVLKGLQPHPQLKSLKIEYFMGAQFPSWMMSKSLQLDNLKKIVLRGCKKCEEVPALGHLPNLTGVWIVQMDNLKSVGAEFYGYDDDAARTSSEQAVPSFPVLKELHFSNCSELIEWMEAPTSKVEVFPCLEELEIKDCPKLRNAPGHFSSVKKLTIDGNKELTCLPEGILKKNKSNLISMKIKACEKLISFAPDVFDCCASLRELYASDCKELRHLPDGLDTLPLRELIIEECSGLLGQLSGLEYCTSLQVLNIERCKNITFISMHNLVSLRKLKIRFCVRLSGPLSGLEYCTSLQEIEIESCDILTSMIEIPPQGRKGGRGCISLASLEILRIQFCGELTSLPALQHFPSLRVLDISRCPKLTSISSSSINQSEDCADELPKPPHGLVDLLIRGCHGIKCLPDLQSFTSLRHLTIEDCEWESIPSLDNLTSLHTLEIYNWKKLKYLPTALGLHSSTRLKYLGIGGFWEALDSFPDFQVGIELSQLEILTVHGWPKLKSLPQQILQHSTHSLTVLWIREFEGVEELPEWLGNLTSLTKLWIWNCKKLKSLPPAQAMQRLTKLHTLRIWRCPLLKERCKKDNGPEWHKISHIPGLIVVR